MPYERMADGQVLPAAKINELQIGLETLEEGGVGGVASVYNVRDYGATGNGTTNDRAAVQSAIDAAIAAGGGVVFFPTGVYKAQITTPTTDGSPPSDGQHSLVIDGDNITLLGELGAVIDCYVYGGDPDTNWEIVGGGVWRGGGILITGGTTYATRRQNVRIEGLEIRGNFTYTGDHGWPADISDGTGWDTTHKGIWYENDTYHDNMVVTRCHVHGFSGEVIYSGGSDSGNEPNLGAFEITHCHVHDSNGSLISMAARDIVIAHNRIHTCAGGGVENSYSQGHHLIHSNRIYECDLDGIAMVGYGEGFGGTNIHSNIIGPSEDFGVGLMSCWNALVHHNTIIDCGLGGVRQEIGSGYPNDWSQDVDVFDNLILADTVNMGIGILCGFGTSAARRIRVHRNKVARTEYAADNSFVIAEPISVYPATDLNEIDLRDNSYYGTHGHSTSAHVVDKLITATGNQYPVSRKPPTKSLVLVSVAIRVVTASTTVQIRIHDGSQYVATVQTSASLATGYYSYPSYLVPAASRATVSVEVNAGTANQVYISATIREA